MEDSPKCHSLAKELGRNVNSDITSTGSVSVEGCNNIVSPTSSLNSHIVSSHLSLTYKDATIPSVPTISLVVSIGFYYSPNVPFLPLLKMFSEPTKISVEDLIKRNQLVSLSSQAAAIVSELIAS